VYLYRYSVSQYNEFCRHNPLCCFSTSVYCCLFRYRLIPGTFGYTLVHWRSWPIWEKSIVTLQISHGVGTSHLLPVRLPLTCTIRGTAWDNPCATIKARGTMAISYESWSSFCGRPHVIRNQSTLTFNITLSFSLRHNDFHYPFAPHSRI
jgi:hypothetical protein